MESIIVGIFMGIIGMGYFIYGKKNAEFNFLLFGVVLMIYPYLVKSAVTSLVLGVIFTLCPFLIKRFF
jgi:hypothetical protein